MTCGCGQRCSGLCHCLHCTVRSLRLRPFPGGPSFIIASLTLFALWPAMQHLPWPCNPVPIAPSLRSIPYIVYLVAGAIGVAGAYVVYLHGKARWQVPGLETSTWVSRLHAGAHAGQPPLEI